LKYMQIILTKILITHPKTIISQVFQ